jgi:hypothetical protein
MHVEREKDSSEKGSKRGEFFDPTRYRPVLVGVLNKAT